MTRPALLLFAASLAGLAWSAGVVWACKQLDET